jgi:hypothetical protein
MRNIIILLCLVSIILWLSGCSEKSSEINYNPNVLSSKEYIRGEDGLMEILNAFLKGVHDTNVHSNCYAYIDDCSIHYFPEQNLIHYGYGAVNRYCIDGKFRRGYFTAQFSGPVFEEGVIVNISTDTLFVDDFPIEADMTIQNLGTNGQGQPEYTFNILSSEVYLPDTVKTTGVKITANFTLTWIEGYSTPAIHEDDIYTITGTASGISTDEYSFSIEIQDPLINELDCFWISWGYSVISVPSADFTTGDIDYLYEDECNNELHYFFNDNLFYDMIK